MEAPQSPRRQDGAVLPLPRSLKVNKAAATNAKAPSLLTGLVYDEAGDRLCPTHADKKGRRYRYYISKRLVHRADSIGAGWRLPAKELDGAVAQAVSDFPTDELRVIDALQLTGIAPDRLRTILHRAAAAADDLKAKTPEHQRRLLHRLFRRVTLLHRFDAHRDQVRGPRQLGLGEWCPPRSAPGRAD